MRDDEILDELDELWRNSPAHLQTYLAVNYPEMWVALNKISKR